MENITINAIIYAVGTVLLGIVGFLGSRSLSHYDKRFDAQDSTIGKTDGKIDKLGSEIWQAINKFKAEMRAEFRENFDAVNQKQGTENGRIVARLDDLNRGREENRMCIREIKGEIKTIKAICERNHEDDK